MATTEFTVNEEDCAHQLRAAARKISELQSVNGGGSELADAVKRDLANAEANIKGMEREIRGITGRARVKRQLKQRVKNYRADWQRQHKDLERLTAVQQRSELFGHRGGGGAGGDPGRAGTAEADHQARLDDANRRLDHGTDLIAQANRTVQETEQIGIGTMDNLHGQREQLLGAHEKVRETAAKTIEARGILNRMFFRAVYNRLFLYGIIVLLLGFIIFMALWDAKLILQGDKK